MENNLNGKEATNEELDELFKLLGLAPLKESEPIAAESEPTKESKAIDEICKMIGI